MEINNTLEGISRNLRDVKRLLSDSGNAQLENVRRKLFSCKTNLERIRGEVGVEHYNNMEYSIDVLLEAT